MILLQPPKESQRDGRVCVCVVSMLTVLQSDWIQLKTSLFEFPARVWKWNPGQMFQRRSTQNTQGVKKKDTFFLPLAYLPSDEEQIL